jgi:TrmH family RNA methyltransferase
MKVIESVDNDRIKYLRKLGKKKFRDETGQFLVENLRIIHDAMKDGFMPVSLFVTEENANSQDERFKFIIENAKEAFMINEKINKNFSSLSTPSGICAVFNKSENKIVDGNVVYLNAINDPGNLGTILRTALAFGIENVVVDEKCADVYNSKTISAGKDAILKVNLVVDKDLEFLKKIKSEKRILATRLEDGIGVDKSFNSKEETCVVFGNEANGISEEVAELADGFVKIDMSDKIESLNVAISAGVVFWEIWKSRD